MPELPEIETIRRSLLPHLPGRRIVGVEVRERRLRQPIEAGFEARLLGRRFTGVERRGKYLLLELDGGEILLVHLGMSGRIVLRETGNGAAPHDHVVLALDDRDELVFHDPRRFGLMRIAGPENFAELRALGPDPLTEEWSAQRLRDVTRGRRAPIKNLLMDQRVVAGIGNIYASEMLFEAGIRPRRAARSLRGPELAALAAAMRSVLEEAVRLGGSSISDFRDGIGRAGHFQTRHAVYDRAGQPCLACRTPIRRVVLGGRSSYFCPRCQR